MMLNYTKSELYRIVHGRELYLFTGVLCAIVLLSSVLLWAMASTPDFPYATVRFSLSNQRGGHQPERPGRVSVGHAGGFGEVPDRGVRRRSGVRHRGPVARKQEGAVGARRERMRQ